jgi:hypothetical protein
MSRFLEAMLIVMECQISDSIQSKHSTARDLAGTSAKRKAHETTTNASDSPKKRKRDELDPSDPKLKEFLRVMGSSKEKVFRDDPMDVVDAEPTRPQPSAVEGESDDEYEQLPSGKKTQNDTAASRIDRHVLRPLAVTNAAKDDAQDITGSVHKEAKVPNEEAVEVGADHAPEATDDDWLRSRTNRLLDLMDPDDIVPTQPGQIPVAPVEQNNEGPSITEPSHSKEADDTSRDNKESDEQQPDDKLDTIRRTSRLFVRNLPYSTKEEDIRESFEKFGTIEEVRIICLLHYFTSFPSISSLEDRQSDEPQIGTAYTSVYDVNLGDYFSRCFDCLNCLKNYHQAS